MKAEGKTMLAVELGRTNYAEAWVLQKNLFDLRVAGKIQDVLLLNEHEHVYTIGKSGNDDHLLADDSELKSRGAEVFHTDRGGDITYHGPGQLVGYPIFDLNHHYLDIHRYLRDLEEVLIRTLAAYGIEARRDSEYTGVWVGSEKIAAIGVKVSRWVTMHGFALNVTTDLSYFERIIPCGIFHKGVTSMDRLVGREIDLVDVARHVVHQVAEVFGLQPKWVGSSDFYEQLQTMTTESVECHQ